MKFNGWEFSKYTQNVAASPFDQLLKIFQELLMHTKGNVSESLHWLTELDKNYNLTRSNYGMADFIQDLIDKGYIKENPNGEGGFRPSAKMEMDIRKSALNEIFKDLKKSKPGNHTSKIIGKGDEFTSDLKPYEFGDKLENIAFTESFKNAQINHGINNFRISSNDIEVRETLYQSQMSTVLMIDISHSMILYGEDRITPAKKVAMALSELILTKYPKDSLDIIVFGNDAWKIEIKDLPYLQVGPYHTNTVAGLELAMDILRKRKNPNKQIFMITDGKPSCLKIGKKYYKNSFGLDRKIVNRCTALAMKCKKVQIPITTFMIASDPYLMQFIDTFTKANNGSAYYSDLDNLGSFVFKDYKNNKTKKF